MKYHNITHADMLNGEGLRVVLWVSGCAHHCPGCQNATTWDENDGLLFEDDAINEIYEDLKEDWCNGLTLSGGDPLFLKNRKSIRNLVLNIKNLYPDKTIWCYTGYSFEELLEQKEHDSDLNDILEHIDMLCDGKFVLKLADEKTKYVGSTNQRIINVPKSLKAGKVHLWKEVIK